MGIRPTFVMAKMWEGDISDAYGKLACGNATRTLTHNLTGAEENWFYSKKRPTATVSAPEVKRQAFVMQLSTLPSEKIVYLALVWDG